MQVWQARQLLLSVVAMLQQQWRCRLSSRQGRGWRQCSWSQPPQTLRLQTAHCLCSSCLMLLLLLLLVGTPAPRRQQPQQCQQP